MSARNSKSQNIFFIICVSISIGCHCHLKHKRPYQKHKVILHLNRWHCPIVFYCHTAHISEKFQITKSCIYVKHVSIGGIFLTRDHVIRYSVQSQSYILLKQMALLLGKEIEVLWRFSLESCIFKKIIN